MALNYCVTYVTGNVCNVSVTYVTDSLCRKPQPPTLDILWWKVLFFKTWTSAVFSLVFLKKF